MYLLYIYKIFIFIYIYFIFYVYKKPIILSLFKIDILTPSGM